MTARFQIPVGVIQGFFGKPWGWDDRAANRRLIELLGPIDDASGSNRA